ncbi:adhesion G protein-coupled receptor E3-like [Siphateles boraxobius]|uniref:adhesion G protein-coupled receptor E3-like n=1 Tax=Siphateles boraxobius TaxID=180520 RepID=UPI0040635F41
MNLNNDPCYNYTVLDNPWRSINNTLNSSSYVCDTSVSWSGWYRLFINNMSAHIPDTCVAQYSCGTNVSLWIRGGHPTVTDGVVTRDVCGHWRSYCCFYGSFPIKVKACPGDYYVYELVSPTRCNLAYCADTGSINTSPTTVTPVTISPGKILESSSSSSSSVSPAFYGNRVLKANEKLISTLVKPTDTNDSVSFTLAAVAVEVFIVGPNVTLDKIPRLDTTNSSVDIDLIGIAKNNNETRFAAVAFMSYNTMENLVKPDFFNTPNDTIKTMMSTVISATLPKTTNTNLTKPVNFTLKHIREFDPSGSLSCVYWNISEWIVDGCSVLKTNSSYTVCSCVHLSTFALIMQTSRPSERDSLMDLLNLVCVIVGLVFFSLALLTFALCQWSPGVNNVARINICISLLLAHLLFLLTQQFLSFIRPQQVLCAVISGVLHFLFLSGFVWMFIEAVLLFICVKNLSQISSKKREVLKGQYLCVIGYTVALVVVAVSVGLLPEGYGSKQCWIKMDKGFIWSFLGPVCVILALDMILFICIIINLNLTLKNLNAEVSQMKRTKIMAFKTLAQFVILGCSWILGFFTSDSNELEILFLILNSQQGTFIFLVYCVLNDEVRQQYRKFFRFLCCGLKSNTIKEH